MQPTDPFTPEWTPMAPPPPPMPRRERGFVLGTLLALATVGNMAALAFCVLAAGAASRMDVPDPMLDPVKAADMHAAQKALNVLVLVCIVRLVGFTGVWMWKRWGVYISAVVTALGLIAAPHASRAYTLGTLCGAAFLIMLIYPKWPLFE